MKFSIKNHIARLCEQSNTPESDAAFEAWLGLDGAVDLLQADVGQDEIVVYVSLHGGTYIHAVIIPRTSLKRVDVDDMYSWTMNPSEGWTICGISDVTIEAPLSSQCFPKGMEQLVFIRNFERRIDNQTYVEILQKFTHLFDLHWLEERKAYCRIDRNGEIDEIIRIVEFNDKTTGGPCGTAVAFRRAVLDDYMNFTDSVIVRQFKISRIQSDNFTGFMRGREQKHEVSGMMYYRTLVIAEYASYIRGVQIIRPVDSYDDAIRRLHGREENPQYASFIAQDWKNGDIKEISCAPGATANYFMDSSLPYEMSPAFFRPEVLLKYKADPDKYEIHDRFISCRGGWDLKTYDINSEGQVHTYLVYLRDLPYSEQEYWRSYNEHPKGDISKRALTTDFEGRRSMEYDPLSSLRTLLERQRLKWWTVRSERLPEQVHYPATDSSAEWGSELMRLDQLLVEGLEERWLRRQAKALGRENVDRIRSLKLVEECLMGLGFEEARARELTGPLHTLHDLRSQVGGSHSTGRKAVAVRKDVLAKHETYRIHFSTLCADCHEAFEAIIEAFEELD